MIYLIYGPPSQARKPSGVQRLLLAAYMREEPLSFGDKVTFIPISAVPD